MSPMSFLKAPGVCGAISVPPPCPGRTLATPISSQWPSGSVDTIRKEQLAGLFFMNLPEYDAVAKQADRESAERKVANFAAFIKSSFDAGGDWAREKTPAGLPVAPSFC